MIVAALIAYGLAIQVPAPAPRRILLPAPPSPFVVEPGYEAPTGLFRCVAHRADGSNLRLELSSYRQEDTHGFVVSNADDTEVPTGSFGALTFKSGLWASDNEGSFALLLSAPTDEQTFRFIVALEEGSESTSFPLVIRVTPFGQREGKTYAAGYCHHESLG